MKKLLLARSFVLSAALFSSPIATTADEADLLVPLLAPRRVANGLSRDELKAAAGAPDLVLDGHVWVYWSFHPSKVPAAQNLDTLLVVFAQDRVSFFKFCASEPVRAAIAQRKARAAKTAVAVK